MAKKENLEDDNRIVANMNIEGMPWYTEKPHGSSENDTKEENKNLYNGNLSKKELRQFTFSAVLAAIVVWFVFAAAFGLLLLLFIHIFSN